MKCHYSEDLLWGAVNNELSMAEQKGLAVHIKECDQCATHLAQIEEIHSALRSPSTINPEGESHRVLGRLYRAIAAEESKSSPSRTSTLLARYGLIATLLVVMITTFLPGNTTAVTLEGLAEQHKICISQGHHKSYSCHNEVAFAEMVMNEMGVAHRPFAAPKDAFVKGDMCRIDGNKVAHALLEIEGETISFFRLYDGEEALLSEGEWSVHSANIWWKKSNDHLVVLRQFGKGDFGLYTGKVSLATFEQHFLGDSSDIPVSDGEK